MSIAAAVGQKYEDMKYKSARGEVLMEYTLNPAYFQENDDLLPFPFTQTDIA